MFPFITKIIHNVFLSLVSLSLETFSSPLASNITLSPRSIRLYRSLTIFSRKFSSLNFAQEFSKSRSHSIKTLQISQYWKILEYTIRSAASLNTPFLLSINFITTRYNYILNYHSTIQILKYIYNTIIKQLFVSVFQHSLHLLNMISSSFYPPSTLAYPHLYQLLDSLQTTPASSTSSTFTLPTSSITTLVSATTTTTSSTLPPISSLTPSAIQSSPVHTLSSSTIYFPLLLMQHRHIYNNSLPSVNSHVICNKESLVTRNALNFFRLSWHTHSRKRPHCCIETIPL